MTEPLRNKRWDWFLQPPPFIQPGTSPPLLFRARLPWSAAWVTTTMTAHLTSADSSAVVASYTTHQTSTQTSTHLSTVDSDGGRADCSLLRAAFSFGTTRTRVHRKSYRTSVRIIYYGRFGYDLLSKVEAPGPCHKSKASKPPLAAWPKSRTVILAWNATVSELFPAPHTAGSAISYYSRC